MNSRIYVAAIAAALAVACSAPPPEPVMTDTLVRKTATVESIHHPSRLVTLRLEDGSGTTVKVSDEVRNLAQVKTGDQVEVAYTEAFAIEVKPAS